MALVCGVCFEEYDEGTNTPVMLPCGHTLCKACVLELRACPYDRSVLPLERSRLPTNYLVAEQVAAKSTPVHALLAGLDLGSLAVSADELTIGDHKLGSGGTGEVRRGTLRGQAVGLHACVCALLGGSCLLYMLLWFHWHHGPS